MQPRNIIPIYPYTHGATGRPTHEIKPRPTCQGYQTTIGKYRLGCRTPNPNIPLMPHTVIKERHSPTQGSPRNRQSTEYRQTVTASNTRKVLQHKNRHQHGRHTPTNGSHSNGVTPITFFRKISRGGDTHQQQTPFLFYKKFVMGDFPGAGRGGWRRWGRRPVWRGQAALGLARAARRCSWPLSAGWCMARVMLAAWLGLGCGVLYCISYCAAFAYGESNPET